MSELPEALQEVARRHRPALERMKALPQASMLRIRDCLAWLDHVERLDGDRLDWHLSRLGGIGGSESAAVVAWAKGTLKSRKSVQSLVRDKLLRRFPEPPNADMTRGAFLEEHIRAVFERRLSRDGLEWRRREDLEDRVNSARPQAYPWLRASVDGIYDIAGRTVLVDFKAPSTDSLMRQLRSEGNDEYKVQLNHYLIVADAAGVDIDETWLALYDYVRAATDGVQVIAVQRDLLLQQDIVGATAEVWNEWVMQGQVPPFAPRVALEPTQALPPDVEEAAKRAALAAAVRKAAEEMEDGCRTKVKDWFEAHGRVGDQPIYVGQVSEDGPGFMKLSAKEVLDVDKAVRFLEEQKGWDDTALDDLRVPGPYKDVKSLGNHYEQLHAASWAVLQEILAGGQPTPAQLAALAKRLDKKPSREPREFSPELVEEALVACGEMPHDYRREVVSVNPDRRSRGDMDEVALRAHQAVAGILDGGLAGPDPEDGPEAEFMGGVEPRSF